MSLTPSEFKTALTSLGVTQEQFARLVGVTTRAISLWIAGERSIPGPIEAYLRLLQSLPASLQQVELSRLKTDHVGVREGIYGIHFAYGRSEHIAVCIFQDGRIIGADEAGVRYDGDYFYDEKRDVADIKLKITYPPDVQSVFGVVNPYEWSIDAKVSLKPKQDAGALRIMTSVGKQVSASYRFLRPLTE